MAFTFTLLTSESQVCHLESPPVLAQRQVSRLDVSMDQIVPVDMGEGAEELQQPTVLPFWWGQLGLRIHPLQPGPQIPAAHELQRNDESESIPVHGHAHQLENVWVDQLRHLGDLLQHGRHFLHLFLRSDRRLELWGLHSDLFPGGLVRADDDDAEASFPQHLGVVDQDDPAVVQLDLLHGGAPQ